MILGQPVIDCDIHNTVPSIEALFPYLSEHWREYIRTSAFKGPVDTAYPPRAPTSVAPGVTVPEGTAAGSSLELIQKDVLDPWNVEIGILNCAYAVDNLHNRVGPGARAVSVNGGLIAEWLGKDAR